MILIMTKGGKGERGTEAKVSIMLQRHYRLQLSFYV